MIEDFRFNDSYGNDYQLSASSFGAVALTKENKIYKAVKSSLVKIAK